MFHTQAIILKARVAHRCTNCAERIEPGETYLRWVSFDDSAFTNKMHPECLAALQADSEYGGFEYEAYGGDRPTHGSSAGSGGCRPLEHAATGTGNTQGTEP